MSFLHDNKFPIILGFAMLVGLPALILAPNLSSFWRGPDKVLEEYWQDAADENYTHQFTLFSRVLQLRMVSRSAYIKYKTSEKARFDQADPSGRAELTVETIEKLQRDDTSTLYRAHTRYGAKDVEFDFRLKIEKGKWNILDIKEVSDMPDEDSGTTRKSITSRRAGAGKSSGQSSTPESSSRSGTSSQEFELKIVDKIPESQKQKSRPSSSSGEFKGGVKNAKSVLKGLLDAGHDAGLLDDTEYQSKSKRLSSLKKR